MPSFSLYRDFSYPLIANRPTGVEFLWNIINIQTRSKISTLLVNVSIKREIGHFHYLVMQKRQLQVEESVWCTCKFVVLLIKPIVIVIFSLPSRRWILKSIFCFALLRFPSYTIVGSLDSINVFARKIIALKGYDWIKKVSFQDCKKENTPKFPSMEIWY